jgi:metal-sulfur cluster biosynthetic enzyme
MLEDRLWRALGEVVDPDLGESIVDLGLVRAIQVGDTGVRVELTMTTPYATGKTAIIDGVRRAALAAGAPHVDVELTWEPQWTPYQMAAPLRAALGLPDVEPAPPAAQPAWRDRLARRLRR